MRKGIHLNTDSLFIAIERCEQAAYSLAATNTYMTGMPVLANSSYFQYRPLFFRSSSIAVSILLWSSFHQ